MGQSDASRKLVNGVPNADIQGLSEDPVPLLAEGQDLRVGPADVDHCRIAGTRLPFPHLDVGHAVVDAHEWNAEAQRENARRGGHGAQARPKAWPLGEGDGIHLQVLLPGPGQNIAHNIGHVFCMMLGGLTGVDAATSWSVGRAFLIDHSLLVHQGGAQVPRCAFQAEYYHRYFNSF
ncbi:Uncharacterised protein [uncultured archaeon]|nr:Uncharacterised protein [uncultured archaeon]